MVRVTLDLDARELARQREVELVLRRFARGTPLYRKWTAFFEGIGAFWSAIILSLVYFVSVAGISVVMKLLGKDRLDRRLSRRLSNHTR